MFGFLKEKMSGGAKRMTGKTDMLEAACAMCVLVGGADGSMSDDEAAVALERLTTHDALSAAFPTSQIEHAFDKQFKRLKQGMSGKIGLKREVEEAKTKGKATHDDLEMLFCIAIDVASADGNIEPSEMKVLREIGVALGGFDPAKYLS